MRSFDLTNEELDVLVESMESAYRHQHRENWEIHEVAAPDVPMDIVRSVERRLEVLSAILVKLGSSGEDAIRRQPRIPTNGG